MLEFLKDVNKNKNDISQLRMTVNDMYELINQERIPFKSSEKVLEMLIYEVDHEHNRYQSLQNRVGILFPFISGLIFFLFNGMKLYPFKDVINKEVGSVWQGTLYNSILLVYILGIGTLFLSLFYVFKVMTTEEFKRPAFDNYDKDCCELDKDMYEALMVTCYNEAIQINSSINYKKSKYLRKAIIAISIASIFNTLAVILNYIFII